MTISTALIPVHVLALAAVCFLSACGRSGDAAPDPVPAEPVRAEPYEVTLTLAPDAAAKLAGMGERVVVDNMFYGIAREGAKDADETGQIGLGSKEIELEPADQTVSVSPPPFMPGPMSQILEEEGARLLINVYSARRAAEDNLLACDIFDDKVEAAPAARIAIHCELIYPEGQPAPEPAEQGAAE